MSDRGHGDKLARKQEQAIAALLSEPTVRDAARKAGVGEATLSRWMGLDEFREEYRSARRQVLEGAITNLHHDCGLAAQALRRNLECGVPGIEVRAAVAMFDLAMRGSELLEVDQEENGAVEEGVLEVGGDIDAFMDTMATIKAERARRTGSPGLVDKGAA